jgi:hypothetical protein
MRKKLYPLIKARITYMLLIIFMLPAAYAQEDDYGSGHSGNSNGGSRTGDPLADGAANMREGNFRGAELNFRAGLQRTPGDITMQHLLAHAIMNQRRFREADSILFEIEQKDSNQAGTYWYLGLSKVKQLQDSLALGYYKKYVRKTVNQNNPNVSVWLQIGSCYRRLLHQRGINGFETDDMLHAYNLYLQYNPTDPMVMNLRAFMEEVQKRRPANFELRWVWTER